MLLSNDVLQSIIWNICQSLGHWYIFLSSGKNSFTWIDDSLDTRGGVHKRNRNYFLKALYFQIFLHNNPFKVLSITTITFVPSVHPLCETFYLLICRNGWQLPLSFFSWPLHFVVKSVSFHIKSQSQVRWVRVCGAAEPCPWKLANWDGCVCRCIVKVKEPVSCLPKIGSLLMNTVVQFL